MESTPGWYPDPLSRARWRYFDGEEWTARTSTATPEGVLADEQDERFDDDDLTEAELLARQALEDPGHEPAVPGGPDEPEWQEDEPAVLGGPDESEWREDELEVDELEEEDQREQDELEEDESWWREADGLVSTPEPVPVLEPVEGAALHPVHEPGPAPEPELEDGLTREPAPEDELDGEPEPEPEWEPEPEPARSRGSVPAGAAGAGAGLTWHLEPEVEWELDPDAAPPQVEAPGAPAHLRTTSRRPGRRTVAGRRLMAVAVLVALVVAGVAAGRDLVGGDGSSSLDDRHAELAYEGELLGVPSTVIRLVVDGDDVLQDRRSPGRRRVSVVRDGTTYDCPLDDGAGRCTRTDDADAAATFRRSLALFLDPLSKEGVFGAAAAGAQPVDDRTVAGRASRCASVSVPGRPEPYEVCRDAELGFLTYVKGRDLDLRLTGIRVPKGGEIRTPDGVEVDAAADR